jgi:hypothetical protein
MGIEPRQATSNTGHINKPSLTVSLINGKLAEFGKNWENLMKLGK